MKAARLSCAVRPICSKTSPRSPISKGYALFSRCSKPERPCCVCSTPANRAKASKYSSALKTGFSGWPVFSADEYLDAFALFAGVEQTQHGLSGFEHLEKSA